MRFVFELFHLPLYDERTTLREDFNWLDIYPNEPALPTSICAKHKSTKMTICSSLSAPHIFYLLG